MKRLRLLLCLLVFALAAAAPARAVEPGEMLKDPVLEARARALSGQLRCLVCQNESIDESNAELAHELRQLVRQQLVAGDSDAQVRQFLVDRYGEFVLLKPSFAPHTLLLWALPFLALVLGVILSFRVLRRRAARESAALSAEERSRLDQLLSDHG